MALPLVVRSGDLVRVPWKDGGGTTAEVAVAPPGAGFEDFDWRISLADVATEGPFSRFPGVDRTLVLVEGHDLGLDVDGTPHRLRRPGAALRFPGEAHVVSRLGAGPIRDFNVMTRRSRFVQDVRHLETGGGARAVVAADVTVVLALAEDVTVVLPSGAVTLRRLDTIVIEGGRGTASVRGEAVMVGLRAVRQA